MGTYVPRTIRLLALVIAVVIGLSGCLTKDEAPKADNDPALAQDDDAPPTVLDAAGDEAQRATGPETVVIVYYVNHTTQQTEVPDNEAAPAEPADPPSLFEARCDLLGLDLGIGPGGIRIGGCD